MKTLAEQMTEYQPGCDQKTKDARKDRPPKWVRVCLCGHLSYSHPIEHGGDRRVLSGVPTHGCNGPMAGRRGRYQYEPDGITVGMRPTCPCREWRPVAEFDHPRHVIFRSAMGDKHPFLVALSAFTTQVGKTLGEDVGMDEVLAEVEHRFRWLEGARVCAVCGAESDGVWPRYVDDERNSQMRCEDHA